LTRKLTITSFSDNGELVFNEISNAVNSRVEWAPKTTGPWYCFEGSGLLNSIVPSGAGSITNSVPMFYRVVAVTNPPASKDMVPISCGTNNGTDPNGETYALTLDTFYIGRTEVTNDEMVRVMQWAYDNGKLTISSAGVTNAQSSAQELLNLDDSACRIIWNSSAFGVKSTKRGGYPCVAVTWYGAVAYCNYRSEMDYMTWRVMWVSGATIWRGLRAASMAGAGTTIRIASVAAQRAGQTRATSAAMSDSELSAVNSLRKHNCLAFHRHTRSSRWQTLWYGSKTPLQPLHYHILLIFL